MGAMESGMIRSGGPPAEEGERAASPPAGPENLEALEDVPPRQNESRQPEEIPGSSKTGQRHGRSWIAPASLVIAAALLMLGFSPLSRLAASGLPRAPAGSVPVVTAPQRAHTSAVRTVPVGFPDGAGIRTAADVFPYAAAALGEPAAQELMALLNSRTPLSESLVGWAASPSHITYPYRYPPLDAVLDSVPPSRFSSGARATALGAALTVLAAQPMGSSTAGTPAQILILNAGPAAYAVLNRVRAAGKCAPQLNLLLLLTADESTSQSILSQEEQRTEAACPHDPTAAWLVGQSQLRSLAFVQSPTYADPKVLAGLRASVATFTRLAAGYPRDTGALTGFGDAYLRSGTYLRSSEPFTARQDFRLAITEYNRASALGGEGAAAPGVARALIGLGEPSAAARLLAPLAASAREPGQLLELLIAADESAHDFGQAVTAARRLSQLGSASYQDGNALIPVPLAESVDYLDDVSFPLSFGAGQMMPLTDELIKAGGAGGVVQDLPFIPQYRDDAGVTGTVPDCPSWTVARDEILLGHSAQAPANWPAQVATVRPGSTGCGFQTAELELLAETQAGRQPDQVLMQRNSITSDDIADAWQNLLRWAGNLPAAKQAATRWQAARGDNSALPAQRLGEIDFLMHDYNDAAAEFDLAVHLWTLDDLNDSLDIEQAELDWDAALLAAGRATEAAPMLRTLDLDATQGYAYEMQNSSNPNSSAPAAGFAAISYLACEQLGDYESRSGSLHAAVEDYTNALDWVPKIQNLIPEALADASVRPEAVENNAALAYLGLGDTRTAASLENKALAADPGDPVFLMTAGFIADRAGRTGQAARYDREALDSDPGAFPAANDLGVELTREGQDGAAETALRQAVGASPGYPLGWFNLALAESRLGPSGLLASQGAFATANALDPALRDRQHKMTIDASVYRTALDLSKPLPPNWSISQLQQPAPPRQRACWSS